MAIIPLLVYVFRFTHCCKKIDKIMSNRFCDVQNFAAHNIMICFIFFDNLSLSNSVSPSSDVSMMLLSLSQKKSKAKANTKQIRIITLLELIG